MENIWEGNWVPLGENLIVPEQGIDNLGEQNVKRGRGADQDRDYDDGDYDGGVEIANMVDEGFEEEFDEHR